MRLTPLCPLKVHLVGGAGREWKEETEHQAQALVLVQSPTPASPLLTEGTSHKPCCTSAQQAQAVLLDHAGFILTSEIYNRPFSILWTLSRGFNLERKNYGFFPFLFWANLCLPGYKMTGYTKPCWISNYQHVVSSHAESCPSDNLCIFKHFLNPLVLQSTFVTH